MNLASISYIVKALVTAAGFSAKLYFGHSLHSASSRRLRPGGGDRQIMRQTGHRSRVMIDRYNRREQEGRREAARAAGL